MSSIEEFTLGDAGIQYGAEEEQEEPTLEDAPALFTEPPESPVRRRKDRDEPLTFDDPQEAEEHQRLVCMLCRFASSSFATHLNSLGFKLTPAALRSQSLEELQELKIRVTASCLNRNTTSFFSGMVYGGAAALEQICEKTALKEHLKLAGLSSMLKADTQLADTIELCDLTSSGVSTSPWLVLAYALMSNVARCHGTNRFLEIRAKQLKDAQNKSTHTVEENVETKETENEQPLRF